MSAAGSGVRFTPGPFKYNGRVALALVPSLLVAAALGGRAVMGIFTIGTMLWYIMDSLQYREGAFTVVRHGEKHLLELDGRFHQLVNVQLCRFGRPLLGMPLKCSS
jgi:hypothetical protein